MGGAAEATGPDLAQGVRIEDVPQRGALAGQVAGEPVLLARLGDELVAVGGACTHYGAMLADGLVDGETVRCPLHHACFSLRTGEALHAPAFEPLGRWKVEIEGELAFVRAKVSEPADRSAPARAQDVNAIVIVGGGAAGFACAHEARKLGFEGSITILSADGDPPCDRPNLSKDYLAGTAPEAWIPLRDDCWYRDAAIELRLGAAVTAIDSAARTVRLQTGETIAFDRLLLATGARPAMPSGPGFDRENVLALRSLADARAIIARAVPGARAAVLGSSFIGLEAAAALRSRGLEVEIVSTDALPFGRIFGREIGHFLQRLYERNGVTFHLSSSANAFDGRRLQLASGRTVEADFVVVGIGVQPATALATGGIAAADGIIVDACLSTTADGIYAAGDVATYPDPLTGRPIRIEHWATAQRQGQTAARNMLGIRTPFVAVPFFWTEHFGVSLRYVGHCRHWDQIRINGDIEGGDFIARFYDQGRFRASAACGRDRESLEDERLLESMIDAASRTGASPRAAARA